MLVEQVRTSLERVRPAHEQLGLGRLLPVACSEQRRDSLFEALGVAHCDPQVGQGCSAPEEHVRVLGVVLGPKPERPLVEALRGVHGIERCGAIASVSQRVPRRLAQAARVEPSRLGQLERLQVVMGEKLNLVVGPPERLDPGRHALMLPGPHRARDLPVGDVPYQHVAEAVLRLAPHRRSAGALHELLPLQRVQELFGLPTGDAVAVRNRAEPEHLADDGGVLQETLLLLRQGVEPRRDDALHRLRQRGDGTAFVEGPGKLRSSAHSSGFSAGPVEQRRLCVGLEERSVEQVGDQSRRVLVHQRGERDRRGV